MNLKQGIFLLVLFLANIQNVISQEVLSLARAINNGKINIIQVETLSERGIEGINLSKELNNYSDNIFEFIEQVGYNTIVAKLSDTSRLEYFKSANVLPPIDAKANTIAIATNYPEHKEETNVKISPVLFPKVTKLTPYKSNVFLTGNKELLDYEVELAVVYSKNVHKIEDLHDQLLGFMVAVDYSDRASMLKVYDTDHPELAVGFTDSKSKSGYFPVGPVLVVPENWKSYYKNLKIKLWRNHILTQNDQLRSMFWDVPKVTLEALKLGDEQRWIYNNKPISLLPKGYIEKGTIAITGTPGGVTFSPPTKGFIIKRAIKYGLLFKFFNWKPKAYVVDQYIRKLLRKKQFLQEGELIRAHVENLGYIYSKVQSK
ncbi:fumarylacetoacetate hydrolase family protein [Flavivirga eckloniae]|nr:fumarylacetoacetate hydrolase family protein [Flavivirga eckloniae]